MENEDFIRLKNPSVKDKNIRKLSNGKLNIVGQTRLGKGISGVLALQKGKDSTIIVEYIFEKPKWTLEQAQAWIKEHTKSVRSTIAEKPKFENGIWIPILKDNQSAFDSQGNEYKLTKAAIDADYKTYIGGYIDVNHDDKIDGKITDMKRDGEFAIAKIDGLTEEVIAILNSPAYRGVSQESEPIEISEEGEVKRLKGVGLAVVLFPRVPACPLNEGCGLPVEFASSNPNFSLNSLNQNSQIKSTGGTKGNMTGEEISAEALEKIKSENEALKKQNEALTSENAQLKSQLVQKESLEAENKGLKSQLAEKEKLLTDKTNELKSFQEKLPEMVNATLDARAKYDDAVAELKSIAPADKVAEFLSTKPTTEAIQNMVKMLGSISGKPPQAGAGIGSDANTKVATEKLNSAMKKLDSKFKKDGDK